MDSNTKYFNINWYNSGTSNNGINLTIGKNDSEWYNIAFNEADGSSMHIHFIKFYNYGSNAKTMWII